MARRKPNPLSVTTVACKCRFLERAAAEPEESIVFDEAMREYHITNRSGGYLLIYHCPSCGGVAPLSKRHEHFAFLTRAETDRLETLTADIKTVDQAIAVLGKPDHDNPRGLSIQTPGTSKVPSEVASYRVLTFKRLSDVADVSVTDYGVRGVRVTFQGKYSGKPGSPHGKKAAKRGRSTKR
jgi:hypothetical protein